MDKYFAILETANNIIAPGNRCTISKLIEESVQDVLINNYGDGWKNNGERYYSCYELLRKDFNKEAYSGDVPYFYSMYYMLINIPKLELVLIQLLRRKKLPKNLKILDVGSGVGTTSIAFLDFFILLSNLCNLYSYENFIDGFTIDSVEASFDNITVFRENINYFINRLSKYTKTDKFIIKNPIQSDIIDFSTKEKYDLIILSNVLNEIKYEDRKNVLERLSTYINENGEIIIIEPADEKKSKQLNRLKKDITQKTTLKSIAPCGICDNCNCCWSFRTSNIANADLIKYFDGIYSKKNNTKFDLFYNNRLKWSYCILSNSKVSLNITNLNKLYQGKNNNISIQVNIIGNKEKNLYRICDGQGNKGVLYSKEELGFYSYGDILEIKGYTIEKDNVYKVIVDENSNILRLHHNDDKTKISYKNVNKKNLKYILKRFWGFDSFREGQFEIIKNALMGKDILGILPTGAGKSICYQLPAMLGDGITIIVSPLKSLIKDQVNNLHRIGFEYVDYIDSSKSPAEKRKVLSRFKNGSLKILYVAPERLQMIDFQEELKATLKNFSLDYFVIDEAHCASEWGHDFRPSYLKLRDVAKNIAKSSIIAVTATASERVMNDIVEIFNIRKDNIIKTKSLDRKEISLEVINIPLRDSKEEYLKQSLLDKLPNVLHKSNIQELHNDGSGIIFTIYAKPESIDRRQYGTEHILDITRNLNIDSNLYHSKLKDEVREQIQDMFKDDQFPLLVSTKGFGMGIDKPNIRYIIHYCYPNSLEAYYQEAGRSGRDGQHSHSVIIARDRDKQCVQNTKTLGDNEPPCINSKHNSCSYNKGYPKCDYGMQAWFISNSYSNEEIIRKNINNHYIRLKNNHKVNTYISLSIHEDSSADFQRNLFYFQKYGLIKDYFVVGYKFKYIEFGVVVDNNFNDTNFERIINEITERILNFKEQRYNMLQSMWKYVENKKQCRRQFLMDYFKDESNYGEDGCRFCDIEGISNEIEISVTRSLKIDKLYANFEKLIKSNVFDYEVSLKLLDEMYKENVQESGKIRAMRYLEDYPDNPTAIYFTSLINLNRDYKDAYARNQAYKLVNILYKSGETIKIANFLLELFNISYDFVEQIIIENNDITGNTELVDMMLKKFDDNSIKELIYKKFVDGKLQVLINQMNIREK
jgi:RecQ family ATP-dependent DNA helicase